MKNKTKKYNTKRESKLKKKNVLKHASLFLCDLFLPFCLSLKFSTSLYSLLHYYISLSKNFQSSFEIFDDEAINFSVEKCVRIIRNPSFSTKNLINKSSLYYSVLELADKLF